jgi:hypothetical protein
MTTARRFGFVVLYLFCLSRGVARAEAPVYATKSPAPHDFSWLEEIRKLPPLKHPRGNRLPMITWEGIGFDVQPVDVYKEMLARGIAQHVQLDPKMIPLAKAIQSAGAPVVMMQGSGGPWPASLVGDAKKWQHQFDEGYKPKGEVHACLGVLDGWALEGNHVREVLKQYKDAGVTVRALWMDWEGEPLGTSQDGLEQAQHCARCRATVPAGALASKENFRSYVWRLYYNLIDTYLTAPAQEIFPGCSTTNWAITAGTIEHPVYGWDNSPRPPGIPGLTDATNPIAYGNTICWKFWKPDYTLDREHVDQFYTHLLLRQVTEDTINRLAWAPEKKSVPWVDRWCPDDEDPKIPIMSRERYREVLRHCWLRGVDTMQIFNPKRPGFEEIVISEIQDAVAVYDEMLEYGDVLEGGRPIGLQTPKIQDDGVLWSGVRKDNRAVIRTFKQGGGAARVKIEAFPGKTIELDATPEGKTTVLTLEGESIKTNP